MSTYSVDVRLSGVVTVEVEEAADPAHAMRLARAHAEIGDVASWDTEAIEVRWRP